MSESLDVVRFTQKDYAWVQSIIDGLNPAQLAHRHKVATRTARQILAGERRPHIHAYVSDLREAFRDQHRLRIDAIERKAVLRMDEAMDAVDDSGKRPKPDVRLRMQAAVNFKRTFAPESTGGDINVDGRQFITKVEAVQIINAPSNYDADLEEEAKLLEAETE